jgi:hypothetical protein
MNVNMPAPFPGTAEEAEANYNTHYFDAYDERCMDCDCRPWGVYATYPCGADVPRIDVTAETADRIYAGTPLAGGWTAPTVDDKRAAMTL